jgi:transposase-like protein
MRIKGRRRSVENGEAVSGTRATARIERSSQAREAVTEWPTKKRSGRIGRMTQTAWTWLHKLRRAMVRPGRDKLSGWVEVDETYFGGLEEGKAGRGGVDKVLIVIAAEADGQAIGRIRMRVIEDASAGSLLAFVKDCIEPGSTIHTDGWPGYAGLQSSGYDHEVTPIRGRPKNASKLLPRVHRVASLLKRWLLGTHQGAISHRHLPYYLDEFTFRFNRRKSRSRGKLFYRLIEQALATAPEPYRVIAGHAENTPPTKTQSVGVS